MKLGISDEELRGLIAGDAYTPEERRNARINGFQTLVINRLAGDLVRYVQAGEDMLGVCKRHGIDIDTRVFWERKQIWRTLKLIESRDVHAIHADLGAAVHPEAAA